MKTGDFVRYRLGTSRWAGFASCLAAASLVVCAALAATLAAPLGPATTSCPCGPAESKPTAPLMAPALGAVTNFSSVGISIAFPADQHPVVSTDASCLAVYLRNGDDKPIGARTAPWQSITSFYALKLADDQPDSTCEEVAERLASLHEKQSPYLTFRRSCAQALDVQGQKGFQIAGTLEGNGSKEVAVLAVFPGIHQEQEIKFTHALLVQARGEDVSAALEIARAILDSVQIVKVQSPVDSGLFFQSGVKVRSDGFKIELPNAWYVRQFRRAGAGPVAFRAAATDYILKDVLSISVSVASADRPPPVDETYLADMVAGMKASLADDKWTPLSSHLAKLDGQPAAQVMGSDVVAGISQTQVIRQAFAGNTSYTITLTYPKDQAVKAWEAMEKFCEGFQFCPQASPTTKPAKHPDAEGEKRRGGDGPSDGTRGY